MVAYCVAWWEFVHCDGQYDEDGCDSYAVDHYQMFPSLEEAEAALPEYLALDEDAHILVMGE